MGSGGGAYSADEYGEHPQQIRIDDDDGARSEQGGETEDRRCVLCCAQQIDRYRRGVLWMVVLRKTRLVLLRGLRPAAHTQR